MKIWHVGACPTFRAVNGVNATVWALAAAQTALGHAVSVVLDEPADDEALRNADECGFEILVLAGSAESFLPGNLVAGIRRDPPDVVHLHSVFIPRQAALCRLLARAGIPYIVTPHGGVAPHVLSRGRLKKTIYSVLVERPRFNRASAIVPLLPREAAEVRQFVPWYRGVTRWVPNPVDLPVDVTVDDRMPRQGRPQIVYLGRFDAFGKGIDTIVDIAAALPDADFHLYGSFDDRRIVPLDAIRRRAPDHVHFHPPVFGSKKLDVLRQADLYIQTSRWEAFGISVAEAMWTGLPCAVAASMGIADLFHQHRLGLVLDSRTSVAAESIRGLLADRQKMRELAQRAKAFARSNFAAAIIAARYAALYEETLHTRTRSSNAAAAAHDAGGLAAADLAVMAGPLGQQK